MTIPLFLVGVGLCMTAAMVGLWQHQRGSMNAGIVDLGWTGGVGAAVIAAAVLGDAPVLRRVLVGGLGGLWSVRLCLYIWRDRLFRKPEDARYANLREKWGRRADLNFLLFFLMQALLVPLFVLPGVIAASNPMPAPSLLDWLGVGLFLVSLGGESLADHQLMKFRSNPQHTGVTCRAGLWRYSRHPNYFFEWLHWWAYPCFAAGSPLWLLTFIGPAIMLFFLFRVTGIPATEARALRTRGEDYRLYQQTTSAFVPWFPKRSRASS
jgi:steroid 5-alpha reductase family enzyme